MGQRFRLVSQLPGDPMLQVGSVAPPHVVCGSGREGQRGRARDFRAEGALRREWGGGVGRRLVVVAGVGGLYLGCSKALLGAQPK